MKPLAGVLAALALVAGIGIWQGTREQSTTTTTATSREVPAAPAGRLLTAPWEETTTVYLMSPEQAAQYASYRADLLASGAIEPSTSELVVAISSGEEAWRVLRLLAEVQRYPDAASVRVVDLPKS